MVPIPKRARVVPATCGAPQVSLELDVGATSPGYVGVRQERRHPESVSRVGPDGARDAHLTRQRASCCACSAMLTTARALSAGTSGRRRSRSAKTAKTAPYWSNSVAGAPAARVRPEDDRRGRASQFEPLGDGSHRSDARGAFTR